MSAEGLAVLAAQGVAHCPTLSALYLNGKTGVCVCVCVHVHARVLRRLGALACACKGWGARHWQMHDLLSCAVSVNVCCSLLVYGDVCVYACMFANGRGGGCRQPGHAQGRGGE